MDKTLDLIVRRIVENYDPEKILLFGSRAGGLPRNDSDYDILVVADMANAAAKERAYKIRRLFPNRDFSLDVIVKTPNEFASCSRALGHICKTALESGRVIYERSC